MNKKIFACYLFVASQLVNGYTQASSSNDEETEYKTPYYTLRRSVPELRIFFENQNTEKTPQPNPRRSAKTSKSDRQHTKSKTKDFIKPVQTAGTPSKKERKKKRKKEINIPAIEAIFDPEKKYGFDIEKMQERQAALRKKGDGSLNKDISLHVVNLVNIAEEYYPQAQENEKQLKSDIKRLDSQILKKKFARLKSPKKKNRARLKEEQDHLTSERDALQRSKVNAENSPERTLTIAKNIEEIALSQMDGLEMDPDTRNACKEKLKKILED
jgi:hypothetical protein